MKRQFFAPLARKGFCKRVLEAVDIDFGLLLAREFLVWGACSGFLILSAGFSVGILVPGGLEIEVGALIESLGWKVWGILALGSMPLISLILARIYRARKGGWTQERFEEGVVLVLYGLLGFFLGLGIAGKTLLKVFRQMAEVSGV